MAEDTVSIADTERSEELKKEANKAFQDHKFLRAVELYSEALEFNPKNAVLWANRAIAHTKLEEYASAVEDASKAIELNPSYVKGYYRRGSAYSAMAKLKDALKDFRQGELGCICLGEQLSWPGSRGLYLSRGNHESRSMNKIYGFEGEVNLDHKEVGQRTFSDTMAELFSEVFCCLPLAHVLNKKVFIVHGGLFSTDGVKLDDIRKIDRFREPPEEGLMCELLWSDPQPGTGRAPSKRGVGVAFGSDVTERFLKDNNLELVVRSHEVKDEGFEEDHGGKVITVFSAPNYCDQEKEQEQQQAQQMQAQQGKRQRWATRARF
eukprot:jgi/Mesen1/5083/ME000252S04198